MSRAPTGNLPFGRRTATGVAAIVVAIASACSASPDVEVVARQAATTTTTTTTTTSLPATTLPSEPPTTVPSTTPVPGVDIERLDGLLSAEPGGQHLTIAIDGVQPIVDATAWAATWQTLNGRLLGDHLDEQPAGMPPGAVIAGAPTLRTEQRYRVDGLGLLGGEVVEDRYEMLVEMPGVDDPIAASRYIADAVAEAVTDLDEYPNQREGTWEGEGGAYVNLEREDASYDISVSEASLPVPSADPRTVLRLNITRRVAASRLADGPGLQASMFEPLRDRFDRLGIGAADSVIDVDRTVFTSTFEQGERASASLGATVRYPDVAAADLETVLADVAATLGADFERSDEYLDDGEIWFFAESYTDGSYVFEQVGSELVVTLVSQSGEPPVVDSEPPAQASVVGDDSGGSPDPDSNVIDFAFDGLSPIDGDEIGPNVEMLSQGRDAATVIAEDLDIEGMDPPIVVADAPIVLVETELFDPEFDPDTGAVTSAEAYEVRYSQAVEVAGDVRETQLEIQAAIAELLSELYPGESLVEDSYEVIDGRFDDAVVVGGGFPQRLTVSISPLDWSDGADSGRLSFSVRRYQEGPDPTSVGTRADWIDDDLAAMIGVVEPAGPLEIQAVSRSRSASGDGETLLATSGAELMIPAPEGPDETFATVAELIETAGYEGDQFDDESMSFFRPEPARLDRYFMLADPEALIVFADTDPVAR